MNIAKKMQKQWHVCDRCGKKLSSYPSLWRHKQKCLEKVRREIPTFDGSEFDGTKPKSKETMEKLKQHLMKQQRDGEELKNKENGKRLVDRLIDKHIPSQLFNLNRRINNDEPEPENKQKEITTTTDNNNEPPKKKKTKDENNNNKIEESDDDEDSNEEEDSSEGEPDSDDELYQLIQNTFDYVTEYDQQELTNLIEDLKSDVSVEFLDTVELLEELIETYIGDDFRTAVDDVVLTKIRDLLRRLQSSNLSRVKIIKLSMLINDLETNRHRINSILVRLSKVESEEQFTDVLKSLKRE